MLVELPQDLHDAIQRSAEQCVANMFEHFQKTLCYDRDSLVLLDGMITPDWQDLSAETTQAMVLSLGSYLGETLVKNVGAHWKLSVDGKPIILMSSTSDDIDALITDPFDKIMKRIDNGVEADSLVRYSASFGI